SIYRATTHLSHMNPTTRKLVAQGGQRVFTISLPGEWLAKHGLGKGDQVRIIEQGDALLIVAI
ncbi:AbrB/MazE/SpoVT family DNA-binding domain-containing protein, partial [Candidatus Pacearchaeota archaeon]|nr:AbrB/MazE/SpoVT family DNA-binding domain-containing protein [Candidatus Pacearchaeota archaeon]